MMSGRDQFICVRSLATGQTVSNVDRRGMIRGPCASCPDCEQYEVETGLSCEYCGCPPGKHKNLGYFNQISTVKAIEPTTAAIHVDNGSNHRLNSTAAVHDTREHVYNSTPVHQQTARQTEKRRKPLSLADVSHLPNDWTLEQATTYLTLDRAKSVDSVDHYFHASSPELNRHLNGSRSDLSEGGSAINGTAGGLAAPTHSAYDKARLSPIRNDEDAISEDAFEQKSLLSYESLSQMDDGNSLAQSTRNSVTLNQSPGEEPCRIIAMNGGDIVRGELKDSVTMRVEILPHTIRKQHVLWFHNNKKISPRYRVRFLDDRRAVEILSLRKKDAGVYKCQIKYNDGKTTHKTACTMILDVQVPIITPKALN